MLTMHILTAQTYVAAFRDNPKLWGYISSEGKIIIPCKYASAGPFSSEGIAVVREPESKIEKYIDIKGNELKLEVEPQDLKDFTDGLARVKINEMWGYINTSGKLVIPALYKKVFAFSEGRAWATDFNGVVSLFDKQGKTIDISNLGITDYEDFSEGLAAVKIGTTWGYVDVNGKLVIENKFIKTDKFSDGLAAIKNVDKTSAYINKNGEVILSGDYLNCERFDPVSGMARVKSVSGWYYIDKKGSKLEVNTKYFQDFSEGLCSADNNSEENREKGYIDNKGQWVIQPEFEDADDFFNGFALVKSYGSWGAIDKTGKFIIKPSYLKLNKFYIVK